MDINPLLDLTTDCLRFVTEFFEVISQSAPHIYHSALQLVPQSSLVWKFYNQQMGTLAGRVVTGIPSCWDSCTASAGITNCHCTIWSPCGTFIAVASSNGRVTICDSNTLESLSTLEHPEQWMQVESFALSPNGCLLACAYKSNFR